VTLNTLGSWTVTATDPFMSSVTGTSGAISVGAAPPPTPSLYWTDTTTGERVIWMMSDNAYSSSVSLGVVSTEWEIDGTGDFNEDGQTGILWTARPTSSGRTRPRASAPYGLWTERPTPAMSASASCPLRGRSRGRAISTGTASPTSFGRTPALGIATSG
jgi:hypothetical protein